MIRLFSHVFAACLMLLLSLSINAIADNSPPEKTEDGKVTLSGYIKDAQSGEALIGAAVGIKERNTGTQTNAYGFYSITVPPGEYTLNVVFTGYKPDLRKIKLDKNTKLNIELRETSTETNEVVITSERPDANVKSMEMSVAKLDISTIKKIPALLGEVDVIRSIQLLPGISTVGEGSSGYNARGGGVDQNLALIDDAPVYNTSHLFGLFSVYNPDAVKDVKLIKGGIPSQYGGRLSSILDVRLKEGNSKKMAISGGVGLIFSRLTVEAPLDSAGRGSFIVAARRSYADVFLTFAPTADLRNTILNFYDLSAKINYSLGEKDKIYLSGYLGRDNFGFSSNFGFNWGNTTGTLRWNHLFNQKLFMNTTAIYSNYDYRLGIDQTTDKFIWDSRLINYSIKPEFTWYASEKNTVTYGFQSILYDFQPGRFEAASRGEGVTFSLPSKWAVENAVYIGNEQVINPRLTAQYGLRYSFFNYVGPGTSYNLIPGAQGERSTITNPDGTTYKRAENIAAYNNPEARASLKYEINESQSIKASYNRMVQYIHLISNTTAAAPLDVWTPTTNNIKPELADQVAIGWFKNFKDNTFEFSAETYYKTFQNQIDYVDGADLLLNRYLEGELLYGKGRAYGLELYLKKNSGKFTGWISYTLSRTERKIDGINNNEWYAAKYDRLHNLTVVGSYDINDKWSTSGNVVYQSGIPNTLPNARYVFNGVVVPHNTGNRRNNYRVPDYFRLDLSVTRQGKKHTGEKWYQNWTSEWVFSCYNVAGYNNPFNIYTERNPEDPNETRIVKFMVFASPIPSVSYNFKF